MTISLPPYVARDFVQERLLAIFPDGFEYRNYCTRGIAAATVFAMLYVGSVEGSGRFAAPKQVYRMSNEQAELSSDAERLHYADAVLKSGSVSRGLPWYADNSRESIRDETLRQGFIPVGAAIEDRTVATTASKPRYALAEDFAALFDPALEGEALEAAIEAWRSKRLSPAALARIRLVRAGAGRGQATGVLVTLPNGESRRLSAGKSSVISKAVIEQFASRFLSEPGLIWLSESGNKVVERDEALARSIGLAIDASRNLPDIILADLGDLRTGHVLLVFVEVVATDGPISVLRRNELLEISRAAGIEDDRVAFVTAYMDRNEPPLKRTLPTLAWNSFVWLASEPENIIALYGESKARLHALMKPKGSIPPPRLV